MNEQEETEYVELLAAEKHQVEALKNMQQQNKSLSMLDEILEDVRRAADRLEEEIEEHAFDDNKSVSWFQGASALGHCCWGCPGGRCGLWFSVSAGDAAGALAGLQEWQPHSSTSWHLQPGPAATRLQPSFATHEAWDCGLRRLGGSLPDPREQVVTARF